MVKLLGLSEMRNNTQFTPLAALGYYLQEQDFFAPLRDEVQLGIKTVRHEPYQKLIDCVVSILAGCTCVSQINTRIRPDVALAKAWGRDRFAEQSTIADTLDAFNEETIAQLRSAIETIYLRWSRTKAHDFSNEFLILDIDLTGLPASKHAQSSTKGFFSGKKTDMDVR